MEKRLARLEENAFFQEKHVMELDQALRAQQRQLDAMDRRLDDMQARMAEFFMLLETLRGGADDAPPPHYDAV